MASAAGEYDTESGADRSRLAAVRVALALAGIVTLLYTAPLWRQHPAPPQVPPFPLALPGLLDLPMFALALLALVLLVWPGRTRALAAFTFAGSTLLLVLGDQHRWQAPLQMFVLFAIGLGLEAHRPRTRPAVLALLRLYVVTVYLYSGLQKLNPNFVYEMTPWLAAPTLGWLGISTTAVGDGGWLAAAIGAAGVEALMGVSLLYQRTRSVGVVLAVLMHGFILLTIGPFGHRWNEVVWGWNGFMVVVVPALFWGERAHWPAHLWSARWASAAGLALLLLPAGYFLGLVDAYPAHNLYTAAPPGVTICVPPDTDVDRTAAARHFSRTRTVEGRRWRCLDELRWYLDTVRVPPYLAPRVQAATAVWVCRETHPVDILLIEQDRAVALRFDRASAARGSHEFRGCDAVRARAAEGMLGGALR